MLVTSKIKLPGNIAAQRNKLSSYYKIKCLNKISRKKENYSCCPNTDT